MTNLSFQGSDSSDTKVEQMWSKEMLTRAGPSHDIYLILCRCAFYQNSLFADFRGAHTACRTKNAHAQRSGQHAVLSVFLLDVMSMGHEMTCAQRLTLSLRISNEHYPQSVGSLWIIFHLHMHY